MPGRHLRLQESDGSLLITPRALVNPDTNIFDKSFGADMDIEEWQDWMRWDGTAVKSDSTILGRKDSFESTLSSYDITDLESVPFSVCSTDANFSLDDAPFDFADPNVSSQILPATQIHLDLRRPTRRYTTLTAAEQQSLQDIAMPYRRLAQVKLLSESSSPTNTVSSPSQSPSPEPEISTRKNKKRKSSTGEDEMPSMFLCQSRKRGHNAIEKRYRTNLNDKISCLRQGIPPLWRRSNTDSKSGDEGEDSEHDTTDKKTGQQKYGKAAILTRALEYIQHLESTTHRLGDEVAGLKTRVGAFEILAMSGSIIMNSAPTSDGLLVPKIETLESIQADFTQIKHEGRSDSVAGGSRKSSKKVGGK